MRKILKASIKKILPTILISIILVQLVLYQPITADSEHKINKVTSKPELLPYPFSRGSAAWVPEQEAIYIFGGRNRTDMLDTIMKYTPSNDKITILETRLPTVLMGSTAIYDGKHIYIFGGKDYDDFYDTIQRFDPITETLTNMTSKLPNPTVGAAAVWTGKYIYFFGGSWGGILPHKFDSILRFDPVKDNITIMNSTLTYGRSGLAATWDGEFIYILGGSDGKQYSNEVFKYDPKNDTLTTLPGKLVTGRTHIKAQYHNGSIYVFGGKSAPTIFYDQILRYDLRNDEVTTLSETLLNPSELRMHAYDGQNIYIIGGFAGATDLQQFVIFDPDVEDSMGPTQICPSDDNNQYIWVAVIMIVIISAIILNHYHRKREK